MKPKVKICGLTKKEDVEIALESGVDYLGFVFVKNHRHYLGSQQASQVLPLVQKSSCKTVGIFVDQEIEQVKKICVKYQLDYAQLHGSEDPKYCILIQAFIPVFKVFHAQKYIDMKELIACMKQFSVDYYILDRNKQGEGEMIDFSLARKIAKHFPIFLAGGLTAENVHDAIEKTFPFGVDVSSGIETNRAVDHKKIKKFIERAKYG